MRARMQLNQTMDMSMYRQQPEFLNQTITHSRAPRDPFTEDDMMIRDIPHTNTQRYLDQMHDDLSYQKNLMSQTMSMN